MHLSLQNSVIRILVFCTGLMLSFGMLGCGRKDSTVPILIIATHADFGTFTAEILKTEGFNEFMLDSLHGGRVSLSYLRQFDLVILAESKIDLPSKQMFVRYVSKGGNLIAFRPDPALAEMFGILPAGGGFTEGYIGIDTTHDYANGLTAKKMQFHGTADKYKLNEGETIATLFSDKASDLGFPGVVINNYRKGRALAFLYNLPKSIVYTRQGNPLFAGIEKDGIPGLRGMDLFTDGWLDTSCNTINQADEQMALLSHCIEKMNADKRPLPKFWYFPDTLKCLITLTNDGEYKGEADFETQFCDIDSMGARMSLYILEVDKVSKAWVDKWTARGHEMAGHPDDTREAGNPGWHHMDNAIKIKRGELADKYGLPMRTNVNHWFVWCGRDAGGAQDFGATARLEEINGIELDINYAHYDIKSNQGEHFLGPPGINQGNFIGSGHVMKFADASGRTINVYQHFNAVYDQQYNESHDPEGFYHCFKGLLDRSLYNEVFSIISIKSHNDEYYFSKAPLMRMLAYANSHGIPVWAEAKLLDFVKMKDQASFAGINWSRNQLTFCLNSPLKHQNGLTFMVPSSFQENEIKGITWNGKDLPYLIRHVKGSEYALATVQPGENYSIFVNYGK